MSLADAFAPILAAQREQVFRETWGHLAPKRGETHQGHMLFSLASYGRDITLLDASFNDLDDSPWLYAAMQKFIGGQIDRRADKVQWGIWRFDGQCRCFKNGRIKFTGKVRPMRVVYRFPGKTQ